MTFFSQELSPSRIFPYFLFLTNFFHEFPISFSNSWFPLRLKIVVMTVTSHDNILGITVIFLRCTYLTFRFEFETFSCFFIDFFVCRLVCLKPLARKKHWQLTHHYQLGEHRISGVYIFKAGGIVDRLVDRCARDLLIESSNPVWHCT